jgi:hypothetical protein
VCTELNPAYLTAELIVLHWHQFITRHDVCYSS